jgi:transposase
VSLRPVSLVIPEQTVDLARAVFPQGCLAMRIRDLLGPIFDDAEFAAVFSRRGRPALSPARLALISVLQYVEVLTDRHAAHAVRSRIDWKYCLGLDLADQGFDYSILSEFRARVLAGGLERRLLDAVVDTARAHGLLRAGGRQRTDSTHVLAAARDLHRLELMTETVRTALNAVAAVAGDWLVVRAPSHWFDRYTPSADSQRVPAGAAARGARAAQIGVDGMLLLESVYATGAPVELAQLPAIEVLRRTWIQQYQFVDGQLSWRQPADLPPAAVRVASPHDPQARTGMKRDVGWVGYKVHLTETCEPDSVNLVVNVATTAAPVTDMDMTSAIHASLAGRDLLPRVHLVDSGYVSARTLVAARRDHGIELLGPEPSQGTR